MDDVVIQSTRIIKDLVELGGSAQMIDVVKSIWHKRSAEFVVRGDLFSLEVRYAVVCNDTSKRWYTSTSEECEKGLWVLNLHT